MNMFQASRQAQPQAPHTQHRPKSFGWVVVAIPIRRTRLVDVVRDKRYIGPGGGADRFSWSLHFTLIMSLKLVFEVDRENARRHRTRNIGRNHSAGFGRDRWPP